MDHAARVRVRVRVRIRARVRVRVRVGLGLGLGLTLTQRGPRLHLAAAHHRSAAAAAGARDQHGVSRPDLREVFGRAVSHEHVGVHLVRVRVRAWIRVGGRASAMGT